MTALIEPFMGWIMAVMAAIGVIFMAWLNGSQSGKNEAQKEQLENALGNVKKAKENDNEISTMDESDIDDQLSDNGWMRNDDKS